MILKAGKKYVTRCGFIVGETVALDGEGRYFVRYTNMEGAAFQGTVYETGFVLPPGMGRHPLDLVSEIPKESAESPEASAPAQAPTPAAVDGFDPAKPYTARNGNKAEIIGTLENQGYRDIFIIRYTTTEGKQWCGTALRNGQSFAGFESVDDLVNVKTKHTGYVGVYPRGFINDFGGRVKNAMVSALYETEGGVPEILHGERLIKIVSISWEA